MKTLRGTRVVDLSHAVAGPFCTMLLADLGADVVKVEPPSGDHFRPALDGAYYAAINRNKRGICLDLKRSNGKDALSRLLRTADVFVESFTPGTIDRLGFGYEEVKALAPGVIYCSVSGFGQDGPYRDLPGYDVIAQAMSGIMMATGEPDRPPVRIAPSLIDMGTGMNLAIGILASLLDRQSTGEGQQVDVSLLETAIWWMGAFIVQHAMTGEEPRRIGSALGSFAPYQVFTAADGPVFVGVSTQRFWQRFCQVLDLEELLEDPLFSDMSSRVNNREALNRIVAAALQDLTVSEAIGRLREAGVPCAPVLPGAWHHRIAENTDPVLRKNAGDPFSCPDAGARHSRDTE
jgi:crotonobetainyl-CoA:carnitine CoA-transferase CaiB-like acyl-CoA transferase